MKPLMEVLAGISTVVYGFLPLLRLLHLYVVSGWNLPDVASEFVSAVGLVMGIMIIPFVSSLSNDVINAVPHPMPPLHLVQLKAKVLHRSYEENLRKRWAAEARFKWIGRAAIGLTTSFLAVLFISIFKMYSGIFPILCHTGSLLPRKE